MQTHLEGNTPSLRITIASRHTGDSHWCEFQLLLVMIMQSKHTYCFDNAGNKFRTRAISNSDGTPPTKSSTVQTHLEGNTPSLRITITFWQSGDSHWCQLQPSLLTYLCNQSHDLASFQFGNAGDISPNSISDGTPLGFDYVNGGAALVGVTQPLLFRVLLWDKMNCAVRFGNCFLTVQLMYQPCCQGKLGEFTKNSLQNLSYS